MDALANSNGTVSQVNDVWGTINKAIDAVASYRISRGMTPQTQASPTGTISGNVWNPFPATQNAYPQAQGKQIFDASSGGGMVWLIVAAVVAVAALLFLRRG